MASENRLISLVEQDLKDFKLIKMHEVYRINADDGGKERSCGFFEDLGIAAAAVEQEGSKYHRTGVALVLTNGIVGYVIADQDPVEMFDKQKGRLKIRDHILKRVSEAERKVFESEDGE